MQKQPNEYKFILTNTNMPSSICRQVRRRILYDALYPVAQWLSGGCWEHRACDTALLRRREIQKIIKDQKGRKTRSRGWEDTDLVSLFDLPNFSLYCDHKIAAICTSDYIYKLRHRIIQSFGSERTPIGIFIYSTAAFQHKCLFTTPEMVSSHRWRTIAL